MFKKYCKFSGLRVLTRQDEWGGWGPGRSHGTDQDSRKGSANCEMHVTHLGTWLKADSDSPGPGWGLRVCISNQLAGDENAAGLGGAPGRAVGCGLNAWRTPSQTLVQ